MKVLLKLFAAATLAATACASAQTAREVRGPAAVMPMTGQAGARLIVDPPSAGALALGHVVIQYRTENLRLMPVFGKAARDVLPRLGHVHVTVDDAPWHWLDASGEPLVLVGMTPGPHKVTIALADPSHQVLASETLQFVVPVTGGANARGH